jgi:hypothetical protein
MPVGAPLARPHVALVGDDDAPRPPHGVLYCSYNTQVKRAHLAAFRCVRPLPQWLDLICIDDRRAGPVARVRTRRAAEALRAKHPS